MVAGTEAEFLQSPFERILFPVRPKPEPMIASVMLTPRNTADLRTTDFTKSS